MMRVIFESCILCLIFVIFVTILIVYVRMGYLTVYIFFL